MQERREKIVREVDPQRQTGIYDGELVEMLLADPVGKQITSATIISADLSHPAFQRLGEFEKLHDIWTALISDKYKISMKKTK
ncbi:MAG: hypothetical protein AAFN77_24690 [Planctomycetota bacterium]